MGTHTEFRLVPWGSDGTLELLESIWQGDKFPSPFPKESMTSFLLEGPRSFYLPVPEAAGPRAVLVRSALGREPPAMPAWGSVLWGGLLGSQAGTWWGGCSCFSSQGAL